MKTRSGGFGLASWMVAQGLAAGVVVLALASWVAVQHSQGLMAQGLLLSEQSALIWRSLQNQARMAGAQQAVVSAQGAVTLKGPAQPVQGSDGVGSNSDTVTWFQNRETDKTDCQGNQKSTLPEINNTFALNNKSELTCKDSLLPNATFQALAEGVQDMQVLYAQRWAAPDHQSTTQWRSAQQVTQWSQVIAVQFCLQLVSIQVVTTPLVAVKGCRGQTLPNDGRWRWVQRQVFAVPNNLHD